MPSPAPQAELCPDANAGIEPPLRASICIPTRNRARLLRETLESLDRQSVAADRLQVHRNTLQYRLRRIEQRLAVALDDSDTLFALELATRVLAAQQAISPADGDSG